MTQQICKAVEAIKLAYLSKTPIVWLVTGDKEVASAIVEQFVNEHCGSFRSEKIGRPVNLKLFGNHATDQSKESSVFYRWYPPNAINDSKYGISSSSLEEAMENFISAYNNMQVEPTVQAMDENHIDSLKKSIVIVASPTLPSESWINKYIEVIYVQSLLDAEISSVILETLAEKKIVLKDKDRINQLVVSLRGFSVLQIKQSINRCIIAGYFDFEQVGWKNVFIEIRKIKKQMLEGFKGLKWIDCETKSNDQKKTLTKKSSSLDTISSWLEERAVLFEDTEKAQKMGFDIPKGILITGIPGTGKSMMAKVTAQKLELPLISLDMGDLQEGLVGASEQHMVDALRMVEAMAPCVLWIDEIEKAFSGSNSGSSDGGVMRRMFGKFLTWMQEKKSPCFVFATSNDITALPPELFRSERFDDKFFSFMPMVDECALIYAQLIKKENERHVEMNPDDYDSALFNTELEMPQSWKKFLNDIVQKRGLIKMDGNKWENGMTPQYKLFTGADISTVVKLTKFKLLKEYKGNTRNLGKGIVFKAVEDVLKDFMPYGQTNLQDIVKCFTSISGNRFRSASTDTIIDFDDYNLDTGEMKYSANKYSDPYDRALYATIVGAINVYGEKQ